ncbi:MAG: type I polyketide synthase, partial [bacterium]|nr:type I polyketide synthase [bacterium]
MSDPSEDEFPEAGESDIAVVGTAVHFSGARNSSEFWKNLRNGVESIRRYSDEHLRNEGVSLETLRNPNYVKAGAELEDMEYFDAGFFNFTPRDASIMDPQHRHFLECAWEALEDAGHPSESFGGSIGVFAGCGMNAYMMFNILTNQKLVDSVGMFLLRHTGNDKDFLATRVSYDLDLRGPSVNVQTACSTSLVAIHLSCQSLLSGECDMALAGGVTIELPHRRGYVYHEGEILSPDGHCHAFDHRAQGTLFGSGAGIVVLRRLDDALEDGDRILAVIKGSAINNDGAGKVGYLAPSVDGQAASVVEALAVAEVEADTIDYIETHGTGTAMGDPIEVSALTQAFRQFTDKKQFCGIGSVKTNIGHLDTAAGVANFVKVVEALRHREIPPSLNYEKPNPIIDFEDSPFYVNAELREWKRGDTPRRAGVSSLGVGGTNAHLILEEAPPIQESDAPTRATQIFPLSAKNKDALEAGAKRLATRLREEPGLELADVAHTLQCGRAGLDERRVFSATSQEEAVELLENPDRLRVFNHRTNAGSSSVVFMFPGGGAQYPRMGQGLYETEPIFREWVDRGLTMLAPMVDYDPRAVLFSDPENDLETEQILDRPSVQLPLIMIIEHALAQLWKSLGIEPTALIGHSMGENTAACVAGVMSFEDCLGLVVLRGKLFEEVPEGGMMSVALSADDLRDRLPDTLDLATVNAPELCVVSGPVEPLETFSEQLEREEIPCRRVGIAIAAHSKMLEPILDRFGDYLKSIPLNAPSIPIVSNRSGRWMTDEEATDPLYWVRHLRNSILFADGIGCLAETPGRIYLEVGPGKTLGSLTKQHDSIDNTQAVLSSMRHTEEKLADELFFFTSFGRLWAAGLKL